MLILRVCHDKHMCYNKKHIQFHWPLQVEDENAFFCPSFQFEFEDSQLLEASHFRFVAVPTPALVWLPLPFLSQSLDQSFVFQLCPESLAHVFFSSIFEIAWSTASK